ncbi:MAG: DNA-3-methyladenine glycosylase I [Candidatus Limiplasma sp.]|nr:DNA-3-methyladenine glycosylase I [Candidatus Limiplasma sp.]MEA5144486.1 DNA-3-methyladenine glycosylase I [Candidatus Limiplasma sp.]
MALPDKHRCRWPQGELMTAYHDQEWGRPLHDDQKLYEMLFLEGFQAGLSWYIVLSKREAFRAAFSGFDAAAIAAYDEADVARLLAAEGIVRNRLKILGAITNAKVFLAIQQEFGSFERYLWGFVNGVPVVSREDVFPVSSALSDAVSKDLKRRGMKFVGSVTIYSFLESVGVINDHEQDCFVMRELMGR